MAVTQWPAYYASQPSVQICSAELPESTQVLFMGKNATEFQPVFNLVEFNK